MQRKHLIGDNKDYYIISQADLPVPVISGDLYETQNTLYLLEGTE